MTVSRVRSAVLLLLLACGAATAPAQDTAPPSEDAGKALMAAVSRAGQLRKQADFPAALAVLKEAEKKYGATATSQEEAGWVFMDQAASETAQGSDGFLVRSLYADAMVRGKRALALDPESMGATLLLGQSQRAYGDLEGSRETFSGWLKRHEDSLPVRWAWAQSLFDAQQWEECDRQFTKILEQSPDDGRARFAATVAKQWLRVPVADLERGYLEAARLLPDDDRPVSYLVNLHPSDRATKLELLDRVVATSPKSAWARVWIAYLLRKEEPIDSKRALEVLREAAKLAPTNTLVHMNLGETYEEMDRTADAVAEYTLAVEQSAPGAARNASDAIDRLLFMGKGADAIPEKARLRAYTAVCDRNPDVGRYGNNAGLWYRDRGKDYEKSLAFYLRALKAEPDSQDYLNDTALIYLFHLTDHVNQCLPMFEKVLRLVDKEGEPPVRGYWDTLENLCKYWFEKGEWAKVVRYADQRASPRASVEGRPYPSFKAAVYRAQAQKELDKKRK